MEYSIKLGNGHFSGATEILITTERAESSYGVPVAVLVGGPNDGMAFGPGDVIPAADPNDELAWLEEPAATTIAAAESAARNADGRAAVWGSGNKPELLSEGSAPNDLYERFFGRGAA